MEERIGNFEVADFQKFHSCQYATRRDICLLEKRIE